MKIIILFWFSFSSLVYDSVTSTESNRTWSCSLLSKALALSWKMSWLHLLLASSVLTICSDLEWSDTLNLTLSSLSQKQCIHVSAKVRLQVRGEPGRASLQTDMEKKEIHDHHHHHHHLQCDSKSHGSAIKFFCYERVEVLRKTGSVWEKKESPFALPTWGIDSFCDPASGRACLGDSRLRA